MSGTVDADGVDNPGEGEYEVGIEEGEIVIYTCNRIVSAVIALACAGIFMLYQVTGCL